MAIKEATFRIGHEEVMVRRSVVGNRAEIWEKTEGGEYQLANQAEFLAKHGLKPDLAYRFAPLVQFLAGRVHPFVSYYNPADPLPTGSGLSCITDSTGQDSKLDERTCLEDLKKESGLREGGWFYHLAFKTVEDWCNLSPIELCTFKSARELIQPLGMNPETVVAQFEKLAHEKMDAFLNADDREAAEMVFLENNPVINFALRAREVIQTLDSFNEKGEVLAKIEEKIRRCSGKESEIKGKAEALLRGKNLINFTMAMVAHSNLFALNIYKGRGETLHSSDFDQLQKLLAGIETIKVGLHELIEGLRRVHALSPKLVPHYLTTGANFRYYNYGFKDIRYQDLAAWLPWLRTEQTWRCDTKGLDNCPILWGGTITLPALLSPEDAAWLDEVLAAKG